MILEGRSGEGWRGGEVKQGRKKRKAWGESWAHGYLAQARVLAFLTSVRAELGRLSLKILDEQIWSLNFGYSSLATITLCPDLTFVFTSQSGQVPISPWVLHPWLPCPRHGRRKNMGRGILSLVQILGSVVFLSCP